jgi:hypothetical protein
LPWQGPDLKPQTPEFLQSRPCTRLLAIRFNSLLALTYLFDVLEELQMKPPLITGVPRSVYHTELEVIHAPVSMFFLM